MERTKGSAMRRSAVVAGAVVLVVGLWPVTGAAQKGPSDPGWSFTSSGSTQRDTADRWIGSHEELATPDRQNPADATAAAAEAVEEALGQGSESHDHEHGHGDGEGVACGEHNGTEVCAHVLERAPVDPTVLSAALVGPSPDPVCTSDGGHDFRVQPVLAYLDPDTVDSQLEVIRQSLRNVDHTFAESAARTGGSRQVRWVTDNWLPGCEVVVETVQVSTGAQDFDSLVDELILLGRIDPFSQGSLTKYLIFTEGDIEPEEPSTCGLGLYFPDDRPIYASPANPNLGGGVSAVNQACWDLNGGGSAPAHEVMHTLGAVVPQAPNADNSGHCDDEYDLMCYGPPGTMRYVCLEAGADALFDCNNDDYFNTDPDRGQWLCDHWNTSDSPYLDGWNVIQPPREVSSLSASANGDTATVTFGETVSCYGASEYQVSVAGLFTERIDALGFSFTAPPGNYDVTVWPVGFSGALGTPRSIAVTLSDPVVPAAPNRPPVGEMVLSLTDGRGYGMLGYAIDPETGAPARMRVTIPGVVNREYDWNYTWADMPRFTGLPNTQALVFLAQLPPGTHTVCLDALDPQGGGWTRLECHTHTVK
ncbi:MAG: hypothetical protein ACR2OH_14315 [Microthrixaceae bacterium]